MRIAIPTWRDRVSPVFDVAQHLLVVELAGAVERSRQEADLHDAASPERVHRLRDLQVQVLICCAVSASLKTALIGAGIKVLDRMCGDFEELLAAFRAGTLDEGGFAMPGCCRRRQRQRARRKTGQMLGRTE